MEDLPYLDNKVVFDITNAITKNAIDIEIQDSNSETATDLHTKLEALPGDEIFTIDELIIYVQLLKAS